ncbi:MAG: glycosyltransferase family 2 protein [Epsilonproteobacteria bacterium]|nr:glycosyltransferase family 2 protein [Campylobacterota bacterium]
MISVIIPVYNREALIARAIDSVLSQTFLADEIIVVDDGSTDATAKVLERYRDKVKIITQENRGVSSARNAGIKASSGSWITLLDSDDIWHPEKLALQKDYHEREPVCLISHTAEKWMRHNKEIKQKKAHQKPSGWCFEENLDFCKIAPSTIMIAREVFEEVGYFDEALEVCEDYDLWLRMLRRYPLGFVEEVLTTKYAGHENQLSFKYFAMDRFRIEALLKHREHQSVQEEIRKKVDLLERGAKKHQNSEILAFCKWVEEEVNCN